MLELDLFTENNGENILNEIRSKGWLINEANLTVYVDQTTINSYGGLIEPARLYLYNIEDQTPLIDYFIDNSTGNKESDKKINHDGLLEYQSDKKGLKYKIRISEHIKNIVRNDSISPKLGLVVTSSIENSQNLDLRENYSSVKIPISSREKVLPGLLIIFSKIFFSVLLILYSVFFLIISCLFKSILIFSNCITRF